MHRMKLQMLLVISLCFFQIMETWAGDEYKRWNSPRDYEPIIILGNGLPAALLNVPLTQLFLYAYNASTKTWSQIPFQFDQRDGSYDFWVDIPNGLLDFNDELVFMARDMGDKVPSDMIWLDDDDSKNYDRVEITVTDTLNSDKQAWVYLYRSNTIELDPNVEPYMFYEPDAAGAGADTIRAATYIEGHHISGIPDSWQLLAGNSTDILDRQKVRLSMLFSGILSVTVMEEVLEPDYATLEIKKKVGPVRVLKENYWIVNLLGFEIPFSLPWQYYPYSIESGGVSGKFDADDYVYYLRQSFDLAPEATGMKFYNPFNPNGITIDGIGGTSDGGVNHTLNDAPAINWYMITGNQGSFAIIFRLSEIGDYRYLWYYDDYKVQNEDDDTGDLMSYGDTGIEITTKKGNYIIGSISFAYKAFYLGPNKLYELGETLGNNFESPLVITNQSHEFIPPIIGSLPDANGKSGDTVDIPITVSDVTGYGVTSVNVAITFNQSVLDAVGAKTDNTIAASWGNPAFNDFSGRAQVTMSGSTPLEGEGSLVYFTFKINGEDQDTTDLKFQWAIFNNGAVLTEKNDGLFRVQGVIPVELASFEAQAVQKDVQLTWTTFSESNNYGFEVHRKFQADPTWEKIGFVEGTGTTNTPHSYSYVDQILKPGVYSYRLKQIDFDGSYEYSNSVAVTVKAPTTFSLEQNYPNPFNPITQINYQIPENNTPVNITIYNLLGSKIKTLVSEKQSSGFYTVYWDGMDEMGNMVPTGIYMYRLRAGDYVTTKRMVLMK